MARVVRRAKELYKYLRRGEGLDLVAVILIAIIATILGITGVGSDRFLLGLNTTALGLVGIAFLVQRHTLSQSVDRLERATSGARFQDHPPFEYPELFRHSSIVYLAGLDLARTYSNHQADMRDFLQRGGTLRVLLYHPECAALDFAVMRSKRPFSKERQKALIWAAVDDFAQLRAPGLGERFELRLSEFPFPHGVVASNFTHGTGYICLKHYAFKVDSYDKPWLKLTSSDGFWCEQWANELETLWEAGIPPETQGAVVSSEVAATPRGSHDES